MKATQRKEVDMEPLTKARTMGIIFGKEAMRKALTLPKAIAYSGEFLGEANADTDIGQAFFSGVKDVYSDVRL
jgi:hypothetical protein